MTVVSGLVACCHMDAKRKPTGVLVENAGGLS
jgi:hypothetical protein